MTDAQNTPIITPVADPEAGTRIIFLRHGQTDWNIEHRFQGGTDIPPLNDTGREQVRTAIGALQQAAAEGTTVDAIVSSHLSRAVESAEIVAEGLGIPYRGAVDGFQERSFGDLEGQIATRELILASVSPITHTTWNRRRTSCPFLGGVEPRPPRIREPDRGSCRSRHADCFDHDCPVGGPSPRTAQRGRHLPDSRERLPTEVPLQYLDDAIDRLLVQHQEPELSPEEVPAGAENTTLTLIRHGQTDWNKANLMQGITDIPLNDTGREQARTTGQKLADMGLKFTVLVSSAVPRPRDGAAGR